MLENIVDHDFIADSIQPRLTRKLQRDEPTVRINMLTILGKPVFCLAVVTN